MTTRASADTQPAQQLALPEPPDFDALLNGVKARLSDWLDILNEAYADDRISQQEWLEARHEVWDWDSKECMRLDRWYCELNNKR